MSIAYLVFCRMRPRIADGGRVGPVAVSAPRPRSRADEWGADQVPVAYWGSVGNWVVAMRCSQGAGAVAEYVARLVAEWSGGGWIACTRHGQATHADGDMQRSLASDDILDALISRAEWMTHAIEEDARARKLREVVAWDAARRATPADDDWSDV